VGRAKKARPRFRVGDWVSFAFGTSRWGAQVIEYRGPLGINGRHIYRLRRDQEYGEPDTFELSEEDLEAAGIPDKAVLLRYLRDGGLVAMLQENLVRRRERPRAWLSYTPQAELTHTCARDRGVLGGAPVPYFALIEEKVYSAKKEEVLDFLASLGLTRAEAEDVVRAVGTAP
jgi:hypothetical protein